MEIIQSSLTEFVEFGARITTSFRGNVLFFNIYIYYYYY